MSHSIFLPLVTILTTANVGVALVRTPLVEQRTAHSREPPNVTTQPSSTPHAFQLADVATNMWRGVSPIQLWRGTSAVQPAVCTWSAEMSSSLVQRRVERDERVTEWVNREGAYSWWQSTCQHRPRVDYAWNSCSGELVQSQNTMEMCTALNKRKVTSILFIGDSLTRLNAYTAAALLDAEPGKWDFAGGNPEKNAVFMRYTACNGGVRIGFLRNDLLDTNRADGPCPKVGGYCLPWASRELFGAFDVVVVNSGAHFIDDVLYERMMAEASDTMASLSRPSQRVIFRATVPGHSRCVDASEPFKNLTDAELDVKTNPWYEGAGFKGHNEIARRAFEKNGFEYMDVYTPTVQRRDMHVGKSTHGQMDCLHYCLPGPSVLWVDFLMHLIDGGSAGSLP